MKVIAFLFASLAVSGITHAQEPNSDKHVFQRQFVTLTIDWRSTQPINFKKYPLEQLVKVPLEWNYELGGYHSNDQSISITDAKLDGRKLGIGAMVYPFGLKKEGTTLAIRGNYEALPNIGFLIKSPEGQEWYHLKNAQAYDLGIGAISAGGNSDGWGLGSYAFIVIGVGYINEPRGNGSSYFAEAGGRIAAGPLGVEMFFGVRNNKLPNPRPHSFFTVPIGLRAAVTF